MKPCKRIEIVIEQALATRTADLLTELGAPGFTLIDRASGRGDRGYRRADELTGTSTNCIFLIACDDEETLTKIVEGVRPMLSISGGICLVSDAQWVRH
ncbi:MAG: transcriptional regulator [Pseudomonadota bacterium]